MANSEKQKIAEVKAMHKGGLSEKLHQSIGGRYIKDIVYGANDGIITTFAVVSGVAGAAMSIKTVLILGFANLIADGISMGASNYLGSKSEEDYYKREKEMERWEVENLPNEEREEIRRIYARKGFAGADLERAVAIITSDKSRWVEVMMKEELGLIREPSGQAIKSGLVTFISFASAGLMPLLSYLFVGGIGGINPFALSIIITGLSLFTVGAARSFVTRHSWWRAGAEMFIVGLLASAAAYAVGAFLKGVVR